MGFSTKYESFYRSTEQLMSNLIKVKMSWEGQNHDVFSHITKKIACEFNAFTESQKCQLLRLSYTTSEAAFRPRGAGLQS